MPRSMKESSNEPPVTVRELYSLIDDKTDQVNKSIQRVESKLDALESGRLSTMEQNVANIQGRLMMVPLLVSVGINAFFFVMDFVLFKK